MKYLLLLLIFVSTISFSSVCTKGYEFYKVSNVGFCMPYETTISKTTYDNFDIYLIQYNENKIVFEIGARHFGHLRYAFSDKFHIEYLDNFSNTETKDPAELRIWDLDLNRKFFALEFSAASGNSLITYESNNLDSYKFAKEFFYSLFFICTPNQSLSERYCIPIKKDDNHSTNTNEEIPADGKTKHNEPPIKAEEIESNYKDRQTIKTEFVK